MDIENAARAEKKKGLSQNFRQYDYLVSMTVPYFLYEGLSARDMLM